MDDNNPNYEGENCNPNIFYGNDFSNLSADWMLATTVSSPNLKRSLEENSADINVPISSSSSSCVDLSIASIVFHGYQYSKKEQFSERTSFRCSKYRGSSKNPVKPRCKATLVLHADGRMILNHAHECDQQGSVVVVKVDEVYHAEDEMRALIESRINEDATKSAAIIAKEVWDETHLKYKGISI